MADIRLYTLSGIYDGNTTNSEMMIPTPLADTPANDVEAICGKVIKYLLTSKGSDVFNPDYGAYLTMHTQIAESYLPKFHIEVLEDLRNCRVYVAKSEEALKDRTEKLLRINLINIKYDTTTRTRIDIYIEVVTTGRIKALLTIPVDL